MKRIMAIDYGQKRCGIAVTDTCRIIAGGLTTISSHEIFTFLNNYFAKEPVEIIVIGHAKQMDNSDSESMKYIYPFINKLKKSYPDMKIEMIDERFTSKMAFQAMIDGGLSKKDRRNKATIDMVSATIILQNYLEIIKNK